MEDETKSSKKKRSKKDPAADGSHRNLGFEALAALTSSDVIRQVKAGLHRIAPLEMDGEEEPPFPSEDRSL